MTDVLSAARLLSTSTLVQTERVLSEYARTLLPLLRKVRDGGAIFPRDGFSDSFNMYVMQLSSGEVAQILGTLRKIAESTNDPGKIEALIAIWESMSETEPMHGVESASTGGVQSFGPRLGE